MDISRPEWASKREWIDWCNDTPMGVLKRIAELDAENQRLREAIQAAIDCGMVPSSTVKSGGAISHSRQAHVADMLRAALLREGE